MKLSRLLIAGSITSLMGCASFHTGPKVDATAAIEQMRKNVGNRASTVSVSIKQSTDPHWGCGNAVIAPTKQAIERSLERAGFEVIPSGAGQIKVFANVSRCDDGLHDGGHGIGQLNLMLSALTLFVVPTWLKSELHVELNVTQSGKEIYRGTQSTSGHFLGGWFALPFMVKNAGDTWLEQASQTVMEKHLTEMDEQGAL